MTNEPQQLTPAEQQIIAGLVSSIGSYRDDHRTEGHYACDWYEDESNGRVERGVQQTLTGELLELKDNLSFQLNETLKTVKLIEGWISLVQAELNTAREDES